MIVFSVITRHMIILRRVRNRNLEEVGVMSIKAG